MADMNYESILQSFLLLNLKIEERFFKQTIFLDEEIEEQFIRERYKSSKRKKFYSDVFLIFCYIAIVIYIYAHKYRTMFAYICMGCLGVSLILIALSYVKKNYNFNLFANHVIVFLLTIFLNFKVIYIACNRNTADSDIDSEVIRTLIYDFLSSNILAYLTLDTRISVYVSLFLLNLAATIVAQLKSNQNYFYYLDAGTSLLVTIFFFMFKKDWETTDRASFAEKYRFQKFYYYTRDFIKGLNGYYMNVSKDFSVFCDSKMKTLLNDMQIDVPAMPRVVNKNTLNRDMSEMNKINDRNSIMTVKYSSAEENKCNLSSEVLDLFTLLEEANLFNVNYHSHTENLCEKLKVIMLEPATTSFVSVGKYRLKSLTCTKYFDVNFRKFSLGKNNYVYDFLMYDVTDQITSRQNIYEEGIIKEKVMAKIVHEFKTPINSIIGVIGNIEDSINSNNTHENKTTMKHLETIRNLSSYVIFLISDIIHFTNIKSLEEIKIIPQKIDLREISNFSYDILKSLLRCNKSKSEAIQPVFEFDDNIDSLNIKADENRLKQIMLNIISNAVKFTKAGFIGIRCSIITLQQIVLVSISDTGIGIPENEKGRLFNDYQMIQNDTVDNAMGSGLGLSICKSLSSSMNIHMSTTSTFGKGSEFSLAIPYVPYISESPSDRSSINLFFENSLNKNAQNNVIDEIYSDSLHSSDLSDQFPSDLKNDSLVEDFNKKRCEVKHILKNYLDFEKYSKFNFFEDC